MKHTRRTTTILLAEAAASLTACVKRDKVIRVEDDDPEMVAAIAKARSTLPEFWQVYDKRENGERNFALKVDVIDEHGAEHFWVTDLEREDGKVMGIINNDPNIVKNVEFGDRVEIAEAHISDWLYVSNGKLVGNEAVKPLFKSMDPAEAEQIKAMMAEP